MRSEQAELKTSKEEYRIATRKLSGFKSKAKRSELKKHVDDLKINLGWTLFDYGKFEEGLVLFKLWGTSKN